MLDKEDFRYLFEYKLRKALQDEIIPKNNALLHCIINNEEYYLKVIWKQMNAIQLYGALIDEDNLTEDILTNDDTSSNYIDSILNNFKDNLKAIDPLAYEDEGYLLKDISEWNIVNKIPNSYKKKYF